jgi:hypothetical protein
VHAFRALALLLIAVAVPPSSQALELRRVGELRVGSSAFIEWVDAHRYLRMTNEFERTPRGAIRGITFVVADVREQRLLRLPFALDELHRSHPSLFTGAPNVELVHFDGTTALVRFDRREPTRTVFFYSAWNPRTRALSEPRQIGEVAFTASEKKGASRVVHLIGPDPAASRLYFADVTNDGRPRPEGGPLAIRLFRVTFPDLEVDWEMDLALPRRARQLEVDKYLAFSPDGKKLALAEYYDSAAQRKFRAVPPPQAYVIDLERKKVARYPIGRTPYGLSFSRDGRYLAVGSHEDAEIVRIDLEAGRIDRRVKAQTHIQGFATTPSGDALLVMADHLGAPRSIEVRRWSDLSLRETIPVSRLFPGVAGFHPSPIRATADGSLLVSPRYGPDGYPDSSNPGLVTFALEEGATARVARADPTALLRRHVERSRVTLYSYQLDRVGNGEGYFAPMVANEAGEAFLIGTTSDLPEDAAYQDGKSHPYAMWVDANGKLLWGRSLRSGTTFHDYEGASAVATPDGAFIALFHCYVKSGAYGASRLVKLDRTGKVLWEWTSPLGRNARFPEKLQLLPSGTVRMEGHVGTSATRWTGELDAKTGELLRDEAHGR